MLLLKYNNMAEIREAVSGGSIKLALGSLLAAVGVSLSGCSSESAAQQTKPAAEEVKLADAQEAKVFASLPRNVQAEIRAAYAKCMAEVKEFAMDGNEDDPEGYQIELEDGQADCDSIRKSDIGIAKSNQNIEERTRRITTG